MSIRPVKRIVHLQAHDRGRRRQAAARLRLRRHHRVRPVPAVRRFPQRPSRRLPRRLPLASAPRHRDHHLRAGRQRRARRQPGQPRQPRRRRRAVDDRRQRHPAPGDAAGRHPGPHARLPAVGQPARVAEDDRAALPGHQGRGHSRDRRRRRHARARHLRRFLGQARPGRGRRRRPALSRRLRAARQAQDAAGRDRAARLRLCVRRLRHASATPRSHSAC